MKKNVLMFMICMVAGTAFAQNVPDTIIMVDGTQIVANIPEVSKSEIKYLDPTMNDGPIFVLSTEDISSVVYRNGKKQTYQPVFSHTELDIPNSITYQSEDNEVKLIYDPDKALMYLFTNHPLMHNTYEVRNIVLAPCNMGDKSFNVIFDLSNKYEAIGILKGGYAFISNARFRKYILKNDPQSFTISLPYETRHVTTKVVKVRGLVD